MASRRAASCADSTGLNRSSGGAAINAGTVTVNTYGEGNVATPFGGFGLSGFGGRDKSLWAHEQYTELKTIWIDLG